MQTFRLNHVESRLFRAGTATVVLSQYSVDDDKRICVSHECRSIEAVKIEVDRLKAELDSLVEQAARYFPTP